MSTTVPAAPPPSPASRTSSEEADAHDATIATLPSPFESGPYARFPPPLGADGTNIRRRAIIAVALAWVPLAILAVIEGVAIRPDRGESFFLDVSAYSRYLIALPLLILAEHVVLPKLGGIVRHFATTGLIPASESARFMALVTSTRRLLTSPLAAIIILALAYVGSIGLAAELRAPTVSSWATPLEDGARAMSLAGLWRAVVSQPLYTTMLGLWLWRALLWARFLFKTSQIRLQLIASHPDQMGGLRFVNSSIRAFPLVGFAIAAGAAGNVGERVMVQGQALTEYKYAIAIIVLVIVALFAGPLLVLGGPLRRLRTAAIMSYGALASHVGARFERQWLRVGDVTDDALHVQDFSAVTDLFSIVANVSDIQTNPIELKGATPLVLSTLLPFAPLLLLVMPFTEMLKFAAKLLF